MIAKMIVGLRSVKARNSRNSVSRLQFLAQAPTALRI